MLASEPLAPYTLYLSCFVRYNWSNQSEPLEFIQHFFFKSLWKFSRQENGLQPRTPVKIAKLTHNLPAIISTWNPDIILVNENIIHTGINEL